jgi:diaminohydroxyphosphoribosylaminopyrimidine deaminase/5-amino-6-(5-phosphoribosylamino)uracil reductase
MDTRFMKRALTLAKRFEGRTSPNPSVGAVIVSGERIVGEGYHRGPGFPHAEVEAIKKVPPTEKKRELYVTLEPCSHRGRTPPCTERIIEAGITRVYIGMKDPNPNVPGEGGGILKQAGIDVEFGILKEEIERFYGPYTTFVTKKVPFVTLKAALTLDGKIATATGDSRWITSEKSRRFVHKERSISDAVLVGAGTVRNDDPRLTVRLVRGRNPRRVILAPNLEVNTDAQVITEGARDVIIAASEQTDKKKAYPFTEKGVDVFFIPERAGRKLEPGALLAELAQRDIMRLLVEGGAKVFTYFLKYDIFDKIILMYAPKILTGSDALGLTVGAGPREIRDAIRLRDIVTKRVGDDFMVEAYPDRGD